MAHRNLITYQRQLVLPQHERLLAQTKNWTVDGSGSPDTALLNTECQSLYCIGNTVYKLLLSV